MPSLMLDLKRAALDARLSFSRASSATDVIAGVMTVFAGDAPRCTPSTGLLIEESRTNTIRNAQAAGATVGVVGSGGVLPTNWQINSTGGMTTEVIGSGVSAGFAYVRVRVSGTASSVSYRLGFEYNSLAVASVGQAWTSSFYTRLAAGSLSGITATQARVRENDTSGTELGATTSDMIPSPTFARASVTRTLINASTARVSGEVRLTFTSGQAIDVTLDIAAPQVEQGAFATSYIPTSGAAATRAADLCTLATGAWFNPAQGTLWVEAKTGEGVDANASVGPRFVRLDGNSGNDVHEIRLNASDQTVRAGTTTSGTVQSALVGPVWAARTGGVAAYAWKTDDMALCSGGGTVQTDTSAPQGMPTGVSVLRVGAVSPSSGFLNGWIKSVRLWPRRLSDSQLKAMTS